MADRQEQATALEQQIQANPELMQALIANSKKPKLPPGAAGKGPSYARNDAEVAKGYQQSPYDVLKAAGVDPGASKDLIVGVDKNTGQPYARPQTWFERNAAWAVPLGIIGGGLVAGAVVPGLAATSATTPALTAGIPTAIGGESALPTLATLGGLGGADAAVTAGTIAADTTAPALTAGIPTAIGGESAIPAIDAGVPALASTSTPGVASLPSGGPSSLTSATPALDAVKQGSTMGQILRYAIPGVTSVLGNKQANNANDKANQYLQEATNKGLDLNKGVYDTSMNAAQQAYNTVSGGFQPYQAIGQQGLTSLASLAGQNRPDLQRRADFTLPTLDEARAMPGYQFGLDQGIRGVNSSAAARGGLLTGGAVKAADKFATDYATSKYDTLVNQALNAYNTNTSNDLNVYNANTANFDRPFNQAATLASLGQYGTTGAANAANNLANQTINAGGQYGQNATNLLTAGANANAANSVNNGQNNSNTINTLGNLIQQYFANRGY